MSKHYYEKSGLLDAEINITYHEVFQKSNDDLVKWITLYGDECKKGPYVTCNIENGYIIKI